MICNGMSYVTLTPLTDDIIFVYDKESGATYTGVFMGDDRMRTLDTKDIVSLDKDKENLTWVYLGHREQETNEEMGNECIGCPFFDELNGFCTARGRSDCKYQRQ